LTARLSPIVRQRRLAIDLQRLRHQAGRTIEDVANHLECSISKVSRIETEQVKATPRDVRDMAAFYGVEPARRDALMQLAREARDTGWWARFGEMAGRTDKLIGLETEAAIIQTFEVFAVPGLLQTPAYARAIVNAFAEYSDLGDEAVTRLVELRIARQWVLTAADPPSFHAILEEQVLRRPVGGREVMREQLLWLMQCSSLPNVRIQVLLIDHGEHAWMASPFSILKMSDGTPDAVYLEGLIEDRWEATETKVARYEAGFSTLTDLALSFRNSVEFIGELARSFDRSEGHEK
jgi:transcriptional regulator with XRE-family HTH domain